MGDATDKKLKDVAKEAAKKAVKEVVEEVKAAAEPSGGFLSQINPQKTVISLTVAVSIVVAALAAQQWFNGKFTEMATLARTEHAASQAAADQKHSELKTRIRELEISMETRTEDRITRDQIAHWIDLFRALNPEIKNIPEAP